MPDLLGRNQVQPITKGMRLAGIAAVLMISAVSYSFADPVTIHFLTEDKLENFKPVIDAFEKAHPDITVDFQTVPFDSMNPQIEARIGGKDSSLDVYMVDTPRVPSLAGRGFLTNLDDELDNVKAVTTPEALGVLEYKGNLVALPLWTSSQLLYYNKDLLSKAGISDPGTDESARLTYEQVLSDAKKAQAAGAKWGFAFDQIDRYYQLQPIFESVGAGPGLTGPNMLTPDVTNSKWVQGAKFYASLFADGYAPRGIADEQMPALFAAGQDAYFVGGPWNMGTFDAAAGLNYGVAPVPYFQGGKPITPTDSWAIGINPYAAHPAEAKLFAEFMTVNPQGNLLTVAVNPNIPANNTAFASYINDMAKAHPKSGEDAKKITTYELKDTAVSRPRSIGYVAFETVMNKVFSDLRDGADVQSTLNQAQNQLKSTLSRIR
jgi:multiple sugar transport system substrate-binding protein